MTTDLQKRAEQILQYTFNNSALLKESLTHASIADNRLNSNERMEFLGDAVLDLVDLRGAVQEISRICWKAI